MRQTFWRVAAAVVAALATILVITIMALAAPASTQAPLPETAGMEIGR